MARSHGDAPFPWGRDRLTEVRANLCMTALVANRYNPVTAEFFKRFIANGKKSKRAIVACMRKMLTMLNAMMRDNAEWRGMPESA